MAARSRSALAGTGGEKTQPKSHAPRPSKSLAPAVAGRRPGARPGSRASASRRQAPLLALTGVVVGTWEVGRFLHVVLG